MPVIMHRYAPLIVVISDIKFAISAPRAALSANHFAMIRTVEDKVTSPQIFYAPEARTLVRFYVANSQHEDCPMVNEP